MRKLATVEQVSSVEPIEGADRLEVLSVKGWKVVSQKGMYNPGDYVVFHEIDSLLPESDPRYKDLMARGVRTDAEGNRGHVLKTIKLRGQISQGFVMPLSEFVDVLWQGDQWTVPEVGLDLTQRLGIVVYEKPVPASMGGQISGTRPSWIAKTDEERIQNNPHFLTLPSIDWIPLEKLDGSSGTYWVDRSSESKYGVSSRNWEIVFNKDNTFWKLADKYSLHSKMENAFPEAKRIVIQGEVFGEGIQANPLKIKGQDFRVFNVIVDGVRIARSQWPQTFLEISVPVIDSLKFPESVKQALENVDGMMSVLNPKAKAEGVVWRGQWKDGYLPTEAEVKVAGNLSFKVLSNSYLLKHDR